VQDARIILAFENAASRNPAGNLGVDSFQDERNTNPVLIAERIYEEIVDVRDGRVLENVVSMNSPGSLVADSYLNEDNAEAVVIANRGHGDFRCLQPIIKHDHNYEEVM